MYLEDRTVRLQLWYNRPFEEIFMNFINLGILPDKKDLGKREEFFFIIKMVFFGFVRSLIPSYIRDSTAAVIVYDVSSKNSRLKIHKFHCALH